MTISFAVTDCHSWQATFPIDKEVVASIEKPAWQSGCKAAEAARLARTPLNNDFILPVCGLTRI